MRRVQTIRITGNNRDANKSYRIHEMSAFDTETFASRAVSALLRALPMNLSDIFSNAASAFVLSINKQGDQEEENWPAIEEIEEKLVDFSTESLAGLFASQFFNVPFPEYRELSTQLLWQCEAFKLMDANGLEVYEKLTPDNLDIYVQEASTIYTLKREAFKLHTDFFIRESAPDLKRFFVRARIRQQALDSLMQNPSISPEP